MKVTLISCWFATSYGAYSDGLRRGLERRLAGEVGVVATNCGCGDPVQVRREFQNRRCDYFEFLNLPYWKSTNPLKYRLRNALRQIIYRARAKRFVARARGAEIVHFQQTLNAYGSVSVFNWLRLPSQAARVVTVHELDPFQVDMAESNLAYNEADRIIVHAQEMKDRLVRYGVHADGIDIIEHGVEIGPAYDGPRSGVIFYGGHHLASNKGLDTLFKALGIIKARLKAPAPPLTIHGHYGDTAPALALRLAGEHGVGDLVRWLNQIPLARVAEEYAKALLCVLPYTGSFAGFAAANAMANGVPVIGTRRAGLPEHLGPAGVWIGENDAEGLAAQIMRLLDDPAERQRLARAGREQAERRLSWDAIAEKTLASYQAALKHRRDKAGSRTASPA